MRGVNNSGETVNAAATAILSAESRVQHHAVQRRRWGACFSVYWCFGFPRQSKRISHAVLVPEPKLPGSDASPPQNPTHPQSQMLPFIAPPSSPVSFFQSEPPSATQSPAGIISFSALSSDIYSPGGRLSIFAIGPYANETQLVSPPVFSTFTTEPSTASFTPPEPVHLTTPSSPEVPFAKFLTSSLEFNCKKSEPYEFHSYQLYPGTPIGDLISPSSACSGTSSPFPDLDFHSSAAGSLPTVPISEPPKILTAEGLAVCKLIPKHAFRDGISLPDGHIAAITLTLNSAVESQSYDPVVDHRVSFELTAEEVARCLGKKPIISGEAASESLLVATAPTTERDQFPSESDNTSRVCVDETCHDLPEKALPSVALTALKEFKFDNSDGPPAQPSVGSDWWANEKVVGTSIGPHKNWAFFPMIQPSVS